MNQQLEPLASHPAPPCAVVIFGASGDLTKRKLVPSLYNLASIGMLAPDFSIIGVARRELSHEDFREQMSKDMQEFATQKIDPALWAKFRERIYYCQGAFDDPGTYQRLATLLDESEKKHGTQGNALFYLSVQPTYFAPIAEHLKQAGLADEAGEKWRRVIVEKRSGTGTISTTCRSPWPSRSAWRAAARSTRPPGRSAT
jgi:glucose-6-phosphate 1-dehydrogenase